MLLDTPFSPTSDPPVPTLGSSPVLPDRTFSLRLDPPVLQDTVDTALPLVSPPLVVADTAWLVSSPPVSSPLPNAGSPAREPACQRYRIEIV